MNKQATVFEYTSYDIEDERIRFHYRMHFTDDTYLDFTETITLPQKINVQDVPDTLLDQVLLTAHIVLGTTYYKTYCPQEVLVHTPLTKKQADFFTVLYRKGLGELLYQNQLSIATTPTFPYDDTLIDTSQHFQRQDRSLVNIGGGKDSLVSAELLQSCEHPFDAFVVETNKSYQVISDLIEQMKIGSVVIQRELDKQIITTLPGSYNGHIPISSIYAVLGLLSAVLYDYTYIVVSNEHSSNFGNVLYEGEEINHQWSKSEEFESLFQDYIHNVITPDIYYYSLLRPFHELRIVQAFSQYSKYFSTFTSCNRNFSITKGLSDTRWCGECPKCLFVFLLLAAYVSERELTNMFGSNLFEQEALTKGFADILGFGTMKPFDCVGTFEEAQAALYLAQKHYGHTYIVQQFIQKIEQGDALVSKVLAIQPAVHIPDRFKFVGMKNCALLGYAVDNQAVHTYLKKYYPELEVEILDEATDPQSFARQNEFDIVVRSPGVSKQKVTAHYTTSINIFFSHIQNNHLTIGVTGTKGKSTTASLMYHVLKTAGKKVALVGNIGVPAISLLDTKLDPDTIIVMELSSYQLDDVRYSPHIAVVLNLNTDHVPYHGSIENYHAAKHNIIAHQSHDDLFVYNSADAKVNQWAKEALGEAKPFVDAVTVPAACQLLGDHNVQNIHAAVTVARHLDISEAAITKALASFQPLEHRLEFVDEFRGIRFYNDALATTPEATIAAIKAVGPVGTLLLGGEDRGQDFSELERIIKENNITNIVLFPDSGERILSNQEGLNVLKTNKMQEAVAFAFQHTPSGTACLLSCASPSFSLWKNYKEKGNAFKQAVIDLQ